MALWLATVLLAFSLSVTASAQTRSPVVPLLPAGERIANARPLRVTLRLGASRVAIGEVPTFTVVIRNNGRSPLLLNPRAVPNIQIFTRSGELVPPASGGILEYTSRSLKRSDFISLGPGRTHEFRVRPDYHALEDYSRFGTYLVGSSESERRLTLPAGDYLVRLTYAAFPDYGVRYDVHDAADVWEGLVEAPSVPLTVLPPAEDDVRDAIATIDGYYRPPLASIELVRLGRVAGAIDPLLRIFARARDVNTRTWVAETVVAIDAGRAAPALIAAIAALPMREREEMMATHAFAEAARIVPDCAAVPLVVEATEDASRDLVATLGDSLREIAGRCPDLRIRLIALLRTPVPVPATYQGTAVAYSRRRAAEALGRIGNPDDVPLLVAVLRRDIPGLPPATNWYGDAAREGAARALGRLGGTEAAAALSDQLNDRTANRFIMPVIVEELGRLNPPGTAEALARLLDSSDQPLLVRVLITLRQLRAPSVVPQLLAALSHSNATVRQYASSALLDLGAAVATADLQPALDSPDGGVRANALFHLARYGNGTALPLFVRDITSDVQFEREASVEAIAKFGTPETFAPLRAALATAPQPVAQSVSRALNFLTFAPIWGAQSLMEWDDWWKTHAQRTRLQWAQEALDAPSNNNNAGVAVLAAGYLAIVQPPPLSLIERSVNHRSWLVRDAAIAAVEGYDRPRAAALRLRELDSRYLAACRNAIKRLSAITGEKDTFDCLLQADRQRARAHWASLVDRNAP